MIVSIRDNFLKVSERPSHEIQLIGCLPVEMRLCQPNKDLSGDNPLMTKINSIKTSAFQ